MLVKRAFSEILPRSLRSFLRGGNHPKKKKLKQVGTLGVSQNSGMIGFSLNKPKVGYHLKQRQREALKAG